MRSVCRASAVVALTTMLAAGCSGPTSVPPDYLRIGVAGSDVLYAKIAHESDGDYADVLLRDKDGDTLCDARGPLMTDATRGFAICDGSSPQLYVYVAQTSKSEPAAHLCRPDGQAVSAEWVRTDETWPADFTVLVDRSGEPSASVVPCSALVAK